MGHLIDKEQIQHSFDRFVRFVYGIIKKSFE